MANDLSVRFDIKLSLGTNLVFLSFCENEGEFEKQSKEKIDLDAVKANVEAYISCFS